MKALPIGRDNFESIIENDCYYVDKTRAIEEILDRKAYVTLFPRPRRFGKSLLISTIDYFFNIEKAESTRNKKLFEGLYINQSKYKAEQGKYPIIKLNFKRFQNNKWDSMYMSIKEVIRQLFEEKRYVLEVLNEKEKDVYEKFLGKTADESEYEQSIQLLSQFMERYWKAKPILLIDEYDVPVQNGYLNGFYEKIVGFIKSLFNNGLKTNDSIKFAIMTGVLRISKESIFSDLNNVDVYGVLNEQYDEYFGFTEKETEELLNYYELELTESIRNMYDGYKIGNKEIYNPWSIINYANRKTIAPYWVNTSGDDLIKDIVNKEKEQVAQMVEDLLLGKSIKAQYNEKITFLDLNLITKENAIDMVTNFLLVAGYLTKASEIDESGYMKFKIPNNEVKKVFAEIIANWVKYGMEISSQYLANISDSLIEGDINLLEKTLNKALQAMSFYDSEESFYHGYTLGLFVNFLNRAYIVKSNREGGKGRFDIMIEKIDRSIGIVVEFKVAKREEELEEKAKKGKEQIKEKEYYKELELDRIENIKTYSVAFYGKKCKVM